MTLPVCRASSYVGDTHRHWAKRNTVTLTLKQRNYLHAFHPQILMHFIPEAICFQGQRDLTWPAQRQPFYPCLTETERWDSVDWRRKMCCVQSLLSLGWVYMEGREIKWRTYGSASIMGNAVSWILEGLLKPMAYTPCNSWGFLGNKARKMLKIQ